MKYRKMDLTKQIKNKQKPIKANVTLSINKAESFPNEPFANTNLFEYVLFSEFRDQVFVILIGGIMLASVAQSLSDPSAAPCAILTLITNP